MKFLAALLFAAGASAASTAAAAAAPSATGCLADYIVTTCLDTEQAKVQSCVGNDYTCLCAAYQAVYTCYNNCPNDPRAAPAKSQVDSFCQAASQLATTSTPAATSKGSKTSAAAPTTAATDGSGSTGTDTGDAAATKTSSTAVPAKTTNAAVAGMAGSAAGMFVAIAGAVAAIL